MRHFCRPVPLSVIGIGYYSLIQGLALHEMLRNTQITPRIRLELLSRFLHAILDPGAKALG